MTDKTQSLPRDFYDLIDRDGRVVPLPVNWNELWKSIDKEVPVERRKTNFPPPLILAGWNFSSDKEKRDRFLYQLEWAVSHGLTDRAVRYLQGLSPENWYYGEG